MSRDRVDHPFPGSFDFFKIAEIPDDRFLDPPGIEIPHGDHRHQIRPVPVPVKTPKRFYGGGLNDFNFSYRYGDITVPYVRFTEPLRLECSHFLECILEHKRPQTDGYEGLAVVKIIEAAQRSLKNNGSQEQIFYEFEPRVMPARVELGQACEIGA